MSHNTAMPTSKLFLVSQRGPRPVRETVESKLGESIRVGDFDSIYLATAYASVAGVRTILDFFQGQPKRSQWLIGLDDAITQPNALSLLMKTPKAILRVVSLNKPAARFHTKFCLATSSAPNDSTSLSMFGSANITMGGLRNNAESAVIIQSADNARLLALKKYWSTIWDQGHPLSPAEFKEYEKRYLALKRLHERLTAAAGTQPAPGSDDHPGGAILATDAAEIDATEATTCWIECGKLTAVGRELEFKAELARFFGLDPIGGEPKYFDFRCSDGAVVPMRIKYQQNSMWRLQLNLAVPEVGEGLQTIAEDGSRNRSPFVAVISRIRNSNELRLQFIADDSAEYTTIQKRSRDRGTIGSTRTRRYGWF